MTENLSAQEFGWVALCILLAAFCLATKTFGAAPPPGDSVTFQGRDASYWRTILKNEPWSIQFYYPPRAHPMWVTNPEALPVLMRLAADPDRAVQWAAIRLIRRYGERGAVATAVLARALHGGDDSVRINALLTLKAIGTKASNAKDEVQKLLRDPNQEIAALAAETLLAFRNK
jgi:hypothetical protein